MGRRPQTDSGRYNFGCLPWEEVFSGPPSFLRRLSPSMIVLSLQNIVKHYGPDPVLAGVTFDLRPGERASLVGPNGAGKTTLLKIISGDESPDSGVVERHSSVRMGYLEQHPEFPQDKTVWRIAHEALDELVDALTTHHQASLLAAEGVQ